MLRKALFRGAQLHGGKLTPFFLLFGLALLCLLPLYRTRRTYIDENAIGHMYPSVDLTTIEPYLTPTVRWPERLVRGRRSPGSETIVVYVNADYPASVSLGNAVIELVRQRETFACDVQFYFVTSAEEWPVPHAYTRGALVLNVSSLYHHHICIDTLGSNGIQSNQDFPNLVVDFAKLNTLAPSYLCQLPQRIKDDVKSGFWHYWAYLEAAVQLPRQPQPWHTIPTHSINTVAISTDPVFIDDTTFPSARVPNRLGRLVLQTLVSLNGLEEKLHHSTFVWLPVSPWRYVEYDHAQFCIVLFVASIFSTAYAEYKLRGVTITPLFVTLLLAPVGAAAAMQVAGWGGVAAASALLALFFCFVMTPATSGVLLSFNAIALCLLIVLQPQCGLMAGAAAAIQLSFIHPVLQSRLPMAVGVAVSAALTYYFVGHLRIPLLGTAGISELFISFVVYPNAVWIGSRFLRLFC